ncbi:hypothetical protein [Marinobacter sp. BSs20148]|uniref:hypothetical protein n=1 Tax=Marinobacter sp. BSs20148 TaxID=490759 RepID=UPI000685C6BE|nr:hypothetical protein [Marinobacter sp. BSs20148]
MFAIDRLSAIIPMTPDARSDVWKLSCILMYAGPVALSTINLRVGMLVTHAPSNPKVILENRRMVTEKLAALWDTGLEVQMAWLDTLSGGHTPWWTTSLRILEPLLERAIDNSKRLSSES